MRFATWLITTHGDAHNASPPMSGSFRSFSFLTMCSAVGRGIALGGRKSNKMRNPFGWREDALANLTATPFLARRLLYQKIEMTGRLI